LKSDGESTNISLSFNRGTDRRKKKDSNSKIRKKKTRKGKFWNNERLLPEFRQKERGVCRLASGDHRKKEWEKREGG